MFARAAGSYVGRILRQGCNRWRTTSVLTCSAGLPNTARRYSTKPGPNGTWRPVVDVDPSWNGCGESALARAWTRRLATLAGLRANGRCPLASDLSTRRAERLVILVPDAAEPP